MNFGENLKIECFYRGINLKKLSVMTGVSYTTLLSYTKKNGVLPRVDIAYKISKVLGVSIEFLLTGNDVSKNLDLPSYPVLTEIQKIDIKYLKPLSFLIHELAIDQKKSIKEFKWNQN